MVKNIPLLDSSGTVKHQTDTPLTMAEQNNRINAALLSLKSSLTELDNKLNELKTRVTILEERTR